MTWLEIRPRDVWLFRDGKPFSAGEDHSAHSMFPPTPLTVQGALRQKISESLGVSLWQYKNASKGKTSTNEAEQAVAFIGKHGDMSDFGKFNMCGPFVGLRTNSSTIPLFPVPADLFKHSKTHDFRLSRPGQSLSSDMGEDFSFPEVIEDFENLPGYWMTGDTFKAYLGNSVPDSSKFTEEGAYQDALTAYQAGKHIWHSQLVYQNDNRFGVSTNALTSFREEGQLYQVQFVRPQSGIGLLVSVNDEIPTYLLEGTMTIGGEQRQAKVEKVENVALPAHPESISGQFKVIFLTPTYFDDGWQPKDGDWSEVFGGHEVTLKSVVLYRPLKIGGWSNANNRARAMHNYVAPGSVYYFQTDATFQPLEAITQVPNKINVKALGFGQYAIGQW
ncbi:type III-B CRISPR module-associated protein Cmr3 [Phototrophicus methaneseepsis]|uniref:Type III-B CRISPR module-associated protein Cmr3 n=1 Tax=Phototrophicus methaneseepsis TaxID=2710758 RepID=A0A7S8E5W1_9CHLR|nr:type III-B CRISPR module-associated protein Cmr3 [Phototrophicus methaneseepsis]QPC80932.1 type III-B CRISPR module-associated protein Cmr3 [Phototrophicus methaneseepsis]